MALHARSRLSLPGSDAAARSVAGGRAMQKLVAEIMAAWRRAERLAESMPECSAEREAALRACD